MTHEIKQIVTAYQSANLKAVLATVVALDGSSYRRAGVRMLILENGKMVGAVSGGCVEKEVQRQAESVFESGVAKVMTYDGRYRLGCEGVLYILIEPFKPTVKFLDTFWETIEARKAFKLVAYYKKEVGDNYGFGTEFQFDENVVSVRENFIASSFANTFQQQMQPCFRLVIIGAEHDAVQLSTFASNMGWEVMVCVSAMEEKTIDYFTGANKMISESPETIDFSAIDSQTAVVLMTHSYIKDLQYLIALKETNPAYLGLLGPAKRREKLLNEFMEHCPEVSDTFFDCIHGPAGLHIGAETPQEICIAIISEILAVTRNVEPVQLKNKQGKIHE